jgi:hypothetical protein
LAWAKDRTGNASKAMKRAESTKVGIVKGFSIWR